MNFRIFLLVSVFCVVVPLRLIFAESSDVSINALVPGCGDGIIENNEQCDGSDLVNKTCLDLGYTSGILTCSSTCEYSTISCVTAVAVRPQTSSGVGAEIVSTVTNAINTLKEIFFKLVIPKNKITIAPFSASSTVFGGKSDKTPSIKYSIKGDLNGDGKVDLVDFSIESYWYQESSPPAYTDINNDGKIDLTDFSVMAFYWK